MKAPAVVADRGILPVAHLGKAHPAPVFHLLKQFFTLGIQFPITRIGTAAVRPGERGETVVVQQITDLYQQMIRRGDIGLAVKGAQIAPGCRVFCTRIVQVVHQDSLPVYGVLENKLRRQDLLPAAEGLNARERFRETDMEPAGMDVPALQKLILSEIVRIAVGTENDAVRLPDQFGSFRPVFRVKENPVVGKLLLCQGAAEFVVQRLKLCRVPEDVIPDIAAALKDVGQQRPFKQRAAAASAADEDDRRFLPAQRVRLPVEAAQRIFLAAFSAFE